MLRMKCPSFLLEKYLANGEFAVVLFPAVFWVVFVNSPPDYMPGGAASFKVVLGI